MTPLDMSNLSPVGAEFGTITRDASGVVIAAGAGTDAFSPPDGGPATDRLPGIRLPCGAGPWAVGVRVSPGFAAAFDAGALMLRSAGRSWAKLAFERAPDGRTMAVSVVTRDASDDANGPLVTAGHLHLRACFTGQAFAFHVSGDGRHWDLVRFFGLPDPAVAVDFVAQSPTGQGCTVRFDQAFRSDWVPQNLRDGT